MFFFVILTNLTDQMWRFAPKSSREICYKLEKVCKYSGKFRVAWIPDSCVNSPIQFDQVVVFIDSEAPKPICVEDQSVTTNAGKPTAMVNWEDPTVSDNSGKVAYIICHPQSGTNFIIGQTTVMCEVLDESGNRADCSFQVNVRGMFTLLHYLTY